MDQKYIEEQRYLKAKKRVKEIKGFYAHFISYVVINIFITSIIVFGLTNDGRTFKQAITHFGSYSTWFFWGIGVFFHWIGVFGFGNIVTKQWEERKIKELMEKEEQKNRKYLK